MESMQTRDESPGEQSAAITSSRAHGAKAPQCSCASAASTASGSARSSLTPADPRGSLGRFFPGGKTQLMTEAIDVVIAELSDDVGRALTKAETFPDAIGVIVAPWRRLLVDHDFALGCPLAATIVDAADNADLRVHVSDLLARVASHSRRRLRQVWRSAAQ